MRVGVLALIAVLAFSAIASASASASQPKAEPEGGTFPVGFTGSSATGGTLETVKGRLVTCTSDSSKGSIDSATTVTNVIVIFKGCTASGPFGIKLPCASGKTSGEIETVALKGTLFYVKAGSSDSGVLLEPTSGPMTKFASFLCGPTLGVEETLAVRGSVVGAITPVNTLTTAFSLKFTQTKGVQSPLEYLDATCTKKKAALETEGVGKGFGSETWAYEQSGVGTTESLTTSKKVKISASSCV